MSERLSRSVSVERVYRVQGFVGAGDTHVVFSVAGDDKKWVVKFPKTHIGFIINVPPDQLFPECHEDPSYPDALSRRLQALQCSPLMSITHPLDQLWTALAVQHLRDRDDSEQTVSLDDYPALSSCDFVRERLADWGAMTVGRSEEESREIAVIHQGDKPIHADCPQFLEKSAREALDKIATADEGTGLDVRHNPLLPWIAAGVSGYTIPAPAASICIEALAKHPSDIQAIEQAAQVWRYAVRPRQVSWERMLEMLRFMLEVVDASARTSGLREKFLPGN